MTRERRPTAHRYALDLPLRYRRAGDAGWREGRTVNASRTGVLFRTADEAFEAGVEIELQFELPAPIRSAGIHCTGAVVRSEPAGPDGVRMAATIDLYRFVAPGDPPARESLPTA
jgi:hypothetical protein